MGDITLRTLLRRARRLQDKFYGDDDRLESHLAQGIISNASSLIDPTWIIRFMDTETEPDSRTKALYAVDSFLYSCSLLSIQQMDVKTLLRVVSTRQKMIYEMHETAKKYHHLIDKVDSVVVLDIDGVLFPYPELWHRFLNSHAGSGMTENEIKEAYRLSGLKATEPPIEGANELIELFKSRGDLVILLSSRPVAKYPEVYMQTRSFLDRYGLKPDLVFFKDHKPIAAELAALWDRVVLFVDDELDYLQSIKKKHENVICVRIGQGDENLVDFTYSTTKDFFNDISVPDTEVTRRYEKAKSRPDDKCSVSDDRKFES